MGSSFSVFIFHSCCVGPAFGPIRAHRHKCAARDLAVIFFPFLNPLERRGIPGAKSCARSTYFLEASSFWIFQSERSSAGETMVTTKKKSDTKTHRILQ